MEEITEFHLEQIEENNRGVQIGFGKRPFGNRKGRKVSINLDLREIVSENSILNWLNKVRR
jgi:hypothetical protein